MAEARLARVIGAETIGPQARLLRLTMTTGELGFRGGQYIIVNTGVELEGGKLAKRAYSIISSDASQTEFQLAVRRIGHGPGSNFMHRIPVGAELPFSGPWGKFVLETASGSSLLFATDTGITAALGLLRGRSFRELVADKAVIWFVEADDYFIPTSFALQSILRERVSFETFVAPPVGHPERLACARALVDRVLAKRWPDCAYLAGDGAVIYPLRDHLARAGVPLERIRLEAFFNNPERRIPPARSELGHG
jgi:ferredoxin-NADP reductase